MLSPVSEKPLLVAASGKRAPHIPCWFMRQAGRALPEFRELKRQHTFWDLCLDPELSARITLMPVEAFDVDAAIIFADLVSPLIETDLKFELVEGAGPKFVNPVDTPSRISAIPHMVSDRVAEALRTEVMLVKQRLPEQKALLGFVAAPFTLACYLIQGQASRDFEYAKAFGYKDPKAWDELLERLTSLLINYVEIQIDAGVEAIQVFDSWAGAVTVDYYRRFVKTYTHRLVKAIQSRGVPVIHFSTGSLHLLMDILEVKPNVIGLDWRVPLDLAINTISPDIAIQGNMDPSALLAGWEAAYEEALKILTIAGQRPGYIFSLGHGIYPQTDPRVIADLVSFVHNYR